jgi:hypothetical protein
MSRVSLLEGASVSAGLIFAYALASAWNARFVAPYRPILERIDVPLPPSSQAPRGFRIGFVTDTHVGPIVGPINVSRALDLLLAAEPEILLLGGDYICASSRHTEATADVLSAAARRVPLGAFAVLGNHDYSNDAARMIDRLERNGIRVLRNQAFPNAYGAGELWIVGIDDAILGTPDVNRAFDAVPREGPAIALWHEPDWAELAAWQGAVLQLSGHSHGGQVRLPLLGNIAAPTGGRRFVAGLNDAAGMPVYTSRGVGIFRPPVRFRCPPEVTLLTLR